MRDTKTPPPAFPRAVGCPPTDADDYGMTLRDFFAALALAGIASKPFGNPCPPDTAAALALDYADALLAARTK